MNHTLAAQLMADGTSAATDVLVDAFSDYPLMRFVVGDVPDYDGRLRTLIAYFVRVREVGEEPVLAVFDGDRAVGAALVTPPVRKPVARELADARRAVWAALGPDAEARYDRYGTAWAAFPVAEPHVHLNMLAVRPSHQGRGISRLLLDAVHRLSADDPGSAGVSLTTETAANVPYYRHMGYQVVGHHSFEGAFDTWGFFRPDPSLTG